MRGFLNLRDDRPLRKMVTEPVDSLTVTAMESVTAVIARPHVPGPQATRQLILRLTGRANVRTAGSITPSPRRMNASVERRQFLDRLSRE